MSQLFTPFSLRGLTLRNRIVVSPMCQYSSREGAATDWHLVHLGSRAVGGAGLVVAEATAVAEAGRITPGCAGIWRDEQVAPLERVTRFVREQGAAVGIQLAHAGRKASTARPWNGGKPLPATEGAWPVVGPSPLPFDVGYPVPRALDRAEIEGLVAAFRAATRRALAAGFDLVEVHAAHGYLLGSFLSPLANARTDSYGVSLEGRARFLLETVEAVRAEWPADRPLLVRISATDWVPGGVTVEDQVVVARWLKERGVDAIDVSSGGTSPAQRVSGGPGYQVPFAARIRREAAIPVVAVGLVTEPAQAEAIVREGHADLVALARELLRDPYWPQRAAKALGAAPPVPPPYARAHSV